MKLLSHLRVLRFEGVDARDYLNRQLSADIESLEDGAATFATLCQPNGRVIALLYVEVQGEVFQVACAASLADTVHAHLKRFLFRDKVVISDAEGRVVHGHVSEDGRPALQVGDASAVAEPVDAQWKVMELEAGIAWLDPQTTEEFVPQMLGYEAIGAVSFRKGCYPGQEIITRMRHLGKLKRHALVLETANLLDVTPMDKVTLNPDGSSMEGVVVDSVSNGECQTTLYLVVRTREQVEVTSLQTNGEPVAVNARWVWPQEES